MYDVRIPDSLYQQASQAAEANHVSVEEFIAEAVRLHLPDDEDAAAIAFFSPSRVAEIREAQAEARTGNNISLDEYRAETPQRRAAWQANPRA